MQITYDREANAMMILLRDPDQVGMGVAEEIRPGVIVHFDPQGEILGLELLDAAEHLGGSIPDAVAIKRLEGLANAR